MILAMTDRVEIVVQDIPEQLRDRLVLDAQERDVSINEAAVSILADKYGVERDPSTRPHRGGGVSSQLLLAMPVELRTAIRVHAAETGLTMRGVVMQALCEVYGLEAEGIERRPRSAA